MFVSSRKRNQKCGNPTLNLRTTTGLNNRGDEENPNKYIEPYYINRYTILTHKMFNNRGR